MTIVVFKLEFSFKIYRISESDNYSDTIGPLELKFLNLDVNLTGI